MKKCSKNVWNRSVPKKKKRHSHEWLYRNLIQRCPRTLHFLMWRVRTTVFLCFHKAYKSVNRRQALIQITRGDAKGQLPWLIHPAVNLTYRTGRMQEVQHSGRNKERASHRDFRHTVLHSRIDTGDHWLRPDRLHISYPCYQRYLWYRFLSEPRNGKSQAIRSFSGWNRMILRRRSLI